MNTCKTCKHWNTDDRYGTGASLSLGRCEAAPMFWESTEWKEDGDGRCWTSEAESKTAFVQDGSDYAAYLYTKAWHGCTMHEQA
jgi:hypothetical protein